MTSFIRILTTTTLDSSPSILLALTNGNKILVNCGDGCQRAFLDSQGLRLKSVTKVCLTHLNPTAIGGLPGLLLTLADTNEHANISRAAMAQIKANAGSNTSQNGKQFSHKNHHSRGQQDRHETHEGIELYGPRGLSSFTRSLRHFMRRDQFPFIVMEGPTLGTKPRIDHQQPEQKKQKIADVKNEEYTIEALEFFHDIDPKLKKTVPIQSFVFETEPLVGKFRPDKAAELGIPSGPLFAKLKLGNTITFQNSNGESVTVHPYEVLEEGYPGVAVVIIYCPTKYVLQQLQTTPKLQSFQKENVSEKVLDLIIHMVPRILFEGEEYQNWLKEFPSNTSHIWMDLLNTDDAHNCKGESPFTSSSLGAIVRSMINDTIFSCPVRDPVEVTSVDDNIPKLNSVTVAKRNLEYLLIPRAKSGIVTLENSDNDISKLEQAKEIILESGALDAIPKNPNDFIRNTLQHGEILLTGTGSALPCKHRNVSGICLTVNGGKRMLLDCGEGTLGQLLRFKIRENQSYKALLSSIQAVWISHSHADHHLGILRLLSQRDPSEEPIILIAPTAMFNFLSDYARIDPTIRGKYEILNCFDIKSRYDLNSSWIGRDIALKLNSRLGITSMQAVRVSHCRDSFAIIIDFPKDSLGKVAYSGDCRPSPKFANCGLDADILIHEATFEDSMKEEAFLKRHCTVKEAIDIANRMKAKSLILTHFSQRYPKLPQTVNLHNTLENTSQMPIVIAFDGMTLTPDTIPLAVKFTDSLRRLYPDEFQDEHNDNLVSIQDQNNHEQLDAKQILSIPGIFTQKDLL
jgi:ribonuclease Z